jgi:hypothetical protein
MKHPFLQGAHNAGHFQDQSVSCRSIGCHSSKPLTRCWLGTPQWHH